LIAPPRSKPPADRASIVQHLHTFCNVSDGSIPSLAPACHFPPVCDIDANEISEHHHMEHIDSFSPPASPKYPKGWDARGHTQARCANLSSCYPASYCWLVQKQARLSDHERLGCIVGQRHCATCSTTTQTRTFVHTLTSALLIACHSELSIRLRTKCG
jgi:hypothetical protein